MFSQVDCTECDFLVSATMASCTWTPVLWKNMLPSFSGFKWVCWRCIHII